MHKFTAFANDMTNGVKNYIKKKDIFGQTVNINFAGAPMHKTVPGGLISIFVSLCYISYAILQFKDMYFKESWALTKQSVLQNGEELQQPLMFRDHPNVSVAI